MSLLQVNSISLEEAANTVLKDISFTLAPHRKMAIAGETGSGKSTLLQTIAGLVQPSAGEIYFQDKKVIGPQDKLLPGHPGIAYLSQHFELPRFLRVEQVLRYANKLTAAEAEQLYALCHIGHLRERRTDHLSGGEQQRIALAKLLLSSPKLFLLDEPFSNLDTGHKNILKKVIRDMSEKLGITLLLVSHDPLDTLSWADEILVMQNGQVQQRGTPQKIYQQPVNEYTATLFGNYNLIPADQAAIFPGSFGLTTDAKDKNILVRPEHFKLVSESNSTLTGQVTQLSYFGSFYEVEVLVANTRIKVKTVAKNIHKGDTVYISVVPEDVWYI